MMTMTPALLRLTALLLDRGGNAISDRICNDFTIPAELGLGLAELKVLADLMDENNSGVDNLDASALAEWRAKNPDDETTPASLADLTTDWPMMHGLAHGLRKMADAMEAEAKAVSPKCDAKRIVRWLRSLDAPQYFYGIPYEGLAQCIEADLDPNADIVRKLAPETLALG